MMKVLPTCLLLLLGSSSVVAFVPHPTKQQRVVTTTKVSMSDKSTFELPSVNVGAIQSSFSDVFSKFSSGDGLPLEAIKSNVLDGELGSRGEVYVLAQLGLLLCIVLGGIPVVGDFLMLLLGPGLFLAGIGVMGLSALELGTSLSPWPVPPSNMRRLETEGLYGEMRHPLYSGLLCTCIGLSIVTGSANRLLLSGVLYYALSVKSDYEETELEKYFPDYEQYKAQVTNKFIPQSLLDQLPWNATPKAALKGD